MLNCKKYHKNPIIVPSLKEKESSVYNPAAIVKNNKVFLLCRSETGFGENTISKINLFSSQDGFNFKNFPQNPVIKPERSYEKMGCEDPRIIQIKNKYFLTYTAYEGRNKKGDYKIKLMGAFSKDLIHWDKTSPLIDKEKSGIIIPNYKYKGQYVMYFGGKEIKIAFSKDLKKWDFIKQPVLTARKGNFFDNHLVEMGPPPILTKEGIFIIIYNGKNNAGKFSIGWAMFDKNNPSKLLKRSKKPILEPTEYWEKYGKVNNVVFATGLVFFKNKWLLYYGGADKSVGVATLQLNN